MIKRLIGWFAPIRIGYIDGFTRDTLTFCGLTPVDFLRIASGVNRAEEQWCRVADAFDVATVGAFTLARQLREVAWDVEPPSP